MNSRLGRRLKALHYDLRKFSFNNRIVNIWNSLPNAVVDVDSVDLFKSRLDNFWMPQERWKLETSNLATRFITRGTNERNAKLSQRGQKGVT